MRLTQKNFILKRYIGIEGSLKRPFFFFLVEVQRGWSNSRASGGICLTTSTGVERILVRKEGSSITTERTLLGVTTCPHYPECGLSRYCRTSVQRLGITLDPKE